ncbi:E3 ubiquitin/ISG15 ligase TRIM25-like [Ascaphus truei]|uniref:E3 ubiquitin/ISG15 ligase TRIM25-like n=1 Tax=Ascaphus truei TaxID=8439 RepID=UPI003F599652
MASAGLREELTCPICLSTYTQPVTLRCGHNFCQGCIGSVWDSQEGSGLYTCPECRAEFQERPALQRNLKLCNIAERFLSTQPEQEEAVIFCTYCVTSSVPAAKTCLLCDASLCDIHLERHSKSEEHVLTEPTTSLKTRKCPVHKKLLECYCTEDAACICVSCWVFGEHRGHQVESLNEASEKKKEKLRHVLEKLTSVREETEKRAQSLQEARREAQEKAAGETARVTALIRDIREQLEVLEKRVLSEITRWEEQVSLRVSDLIQQLEIKKDELSKKILHIEELSNITDPLTVLQGRESDNADLCDAEEGALQGEESDNAEDEEGDNDSDKTHNEDNEDREREGNKVPAVGYLYEVLIPLTLQRLADIVTDLKAKSGFYVQEASGILLDVNTAANNVSVSGDLKTASWSGTDQLRPNAQERFVSYNQVLSSRSFSSGQHYWEVEISDSGHRRVGISYPSIVRKGGQSPIGSNKKSWCLYMRGNDYSVRHDSIQTRIYPESPLQRLGIYLDYEAGRLSFYQLCDPIRHLHTVTATFTEPLHAAFAVYERGWVRIRS